MPIVNVRTLELKTPVTAVSIDGDAIVSIESLHYVRMSVRNPDDDSMVSLRFTVFGNRLRLHADSYTPSVKHVETEFKNAGRTDGVTLEWLATLISEPLPSVGHLESSRVNLGDRLEVGALGTHSLPGSTHDVVIGVVEKIELYVT